MAIAAEVLTPNPALAEPRSRKIVRVLAKSPVQFALLVLGLLWLLPTFGLLITSLLSPVDFQVKGWWQVFSAPHKLTWSNYDAIFHNSTILHSLLTTGEIAIGATLLPIFVAALAAYAFAWLEFPGRDWLFILVSHCSVPLQMALIPTQPLQHDQHRHRDQTDPPHRVRLPFAVFFLRNFFIGIPKDLIEAARIDGASEIYIFVRVILPLGLPAIASLGIFQFLWTWNDLLVALTLARSTQPITVAIFSQLRTFGSNIEIIAPATFVSLIIPLAVFFAFQRYFVQGLLAGSIK
jgi:alpha-glucoside transport system permease protein